MNGKWILRFALILLTAGWMVFIFCMSSEGGEQSAYLSGGVTKALQETFFGDWETLPAKEYDTQMAGLHFFVRKFAHFAEFFVLGMLFFGMFLSFGIKPWTAALVSFGAGALYAVFDELHQSFVSGRSMAVFDMMVDAAGVFFGISLISAALFFAGLRRRHNKDQSGIKPLES